MTLKQDIITASKQNEGAKAAILIISADTFNELEFFYPYYRFTEAGFRVDVGSPDGGEIKGANGTEFPGTHPIATIDPTQYALLYIPGGKAPAEMRKSEELLKVVRRFDALGKPIAAICHAAQVLVSAGLVKGKRIAAYPEVEEEITEAGGTFVNAPLVEDGQYITARWPGDLPGHLEAVMKRLEGNAAQSPSRKTAA